MADEPSKPIGFSFIRGKDDWFAREAPASHAAAVGKVRSSLTEALNAPNIAFLLGAGCSSFKAPEKEGDEEWIEFGIPTMAPLAGDFQAEDSLTGGLDKGETAYLTNLGIDLATDRYAKNLERLMEVLHAQRFVLSCGGTAQEDDLKKVNGIIAKVQTFILRHCLNGLFMHGDMRVRNLYRDFYRKLVYRDRSLPRPWVFTTNYDLFSEWALDGLGISFCNGFSGVIQRTFNPASFKYALAEQLDVASKKWTAVDNHVYLCKLHGSVNWRQDAAAGIHGIREVQEPTVNSAGEVMIFPTPMKQHATIASPYTDLFREFQSRIVREQTVLVTLGYGFGDDHIDAIIHQALTVPTFRLVVFGTSGTDSFKKLQALEDPRIWIISGDDLDGRPVHFFNHVVENFLPELPGARIDDSVKRVADLIRKGLEAPTAPGAPA